ncbi:MAG: hypothetical protein AABX11_07345 [Nanoarchaeota archaeon]
MEKLIWQPRFCGGSDFMIYLDAEFARRMIKSPVPEATRTRMNKLANEDLERFSISWTDIYLFHEGSGFVKEIHLGRGGVWLSTSSNNVDSLLRNAPLRKPIEYHSHNVRTIDQAYAFMYLVDKWVNYSDAMIGR